MLNKLEKCSESFLKWQKAGGQIKPDVSARIRVLDTFIPATHTNTYTEKEVGENEIKRDKKQIGQNVNGPMVESGSNAHEHLSFYYVLFYAWTLSTFTKKLQKIK